MGNLSLFHPNSTNLVDGDGNNNSDIFVRDVTGALPIINPNPNPTPNPAPLAAGGGGGGGGGGCFINITD
jgi:hypothetical protein